MIGSEAINVAVGAGVGVISARVLVGGGVKEGAGELVILGRLTTEVPLGVSICLPIGVSVAANSITAGCFPLGGVHAERSSKQEAISHKENIGFMAKA